MQIKKLFKRILTKDYTENIEDLQMQMCELTQVY